MNDIKKIKRSVAIPFVLAVMVLLWFIVDTVWGLLFNEIQWNVMSIVNTIVGFVIIVSIILMTKRIIQSIRNDVTPFQMKNVKRLKVTAILLVLLEGHMYISEWIFNRYYPIVFNDGSTISVHNSRGGCILIAGLLMYCVSLVFEYGVALQQQADETL